MLIFSKRTIKFKIVLYSTISLMILGILMNVTTYRYFNGILTKKITVINDMNIQNMTSQLDTRLTNLSELTVLITNNLNVQKLMNYSPTDTGYKKSSAVHIQELLTRYTDSSLVSQYVLKAMIFNNKGIIVQSIGKEMGYLDDYENLVNSTVFQTLKEDPSQNYQLFIKPVISRKDLCMPVLVPIYNLSNTHILGWLYMEVSADLIYDITENYQSYNQLILETDQEHQIMQGTKALDFNAIKTYANSNQDYRGYVIHSYPFESYGWKVYTLEEDATANIEDKNMLNVFFLTVFIALLTGLLIFMGTSIIITRPIKILKNRIQKISEKDFSYDEETENIPGEIGEIGHVINNMAGDIEKLLDQSIAITKEKKNYEIAMLQSQVNPHFLYNTLNSIHWMATIQKNTGICKLVDALTSLLKNMARSFSDKVTLEQELNLLEDYITIQSFRYMESFEFISKLDASLLQYKIVRMTLQPLIENAIFHGIEPKGKFGTIVLDGYVEDEHLVLTITDDGVGMRPDKIKKLLTTNHTSRTSVNGIGFYNVHQRLQLVYGESCGLNIHSEVNKFTTITIKIPIEV